MSCSLLHLPDELLLQIFDILRDDRERGKSNIQAWMMSCRRMYLFALPLFYRHISVDLHKAQLLLNTLKLYSKNSRRTLITVESFTVWLPIAKGHRVHVKQRGTIPNKRTLLGSIQNLFKRTTTKWNELTALSLSPHSFQKLPLNPIQDLLKVIKRLDHLTIFSLSSISDPYGKVQRLPSARRDIAILVDALPTSLVSLELDLGCSDLRYASEFSNHDMPTPYCPLCSAIRKRISSLEHLRLRMTFLCKGLLCSLQDMVPGMKHLPLRSLTIWTAAAERTITRPCQSGVMNTFAGTDIMNEARSLYLSGVIPDIKHLVVMGTNRRRSSLIKYDPITDELTVCPYRFVRRPINYMIAPRNTRKNCQSHQHQPPPSILREKIYLKALKVPPANEASSAYDEYIGPYNGLLQLVEGEYAWVPSSYGPRFPERSHCLRAGMRVYECFHDFHTFTKRFSKSDICIESKERRPRITMNPPMDFDL